MSLLILLDEAKLFLKVDITDDDTYIGSLIPLAEEYCENYIRKPIPEEMPPSIKQAALLLIGYFYENRDATTEGVPDVVHSLLAPYREAVW